MNFIKPTAIAIRSGVTFTAILLLTLVSQRSLGEVETGFVSLFNGQTLQGWRMVDQHGDGFGVRDGVIYCAKGGGGNLMTESEFSDFVLRFEFKLEEGSNNGLGIRAPLEGDAAYAGMELQILEEKAALSGKWGTLRSEQFHGSIYDVLAARQGALKPAGEWNEQEVVAQGRQIKVIVNGTTILDADLNEVSDPEMIRKHPGLFRDSGHIGFLGHDDYVEFRNIRIKDLSRSVTADNAPPAGFTALFNGRDLAGWKGLVGDPKKRAALAADALAAAQQAADELMRVSWRIEDGAIVYRGTNYDNLCTAKDYANFELLADWKIEPYSDSGFYLRGSPQVQIWDPFTQPTRNGSEVGSGGLYNNKTNASKPLLVADKPIGEWNRFRMIMVGDRVHIFLNGQLVVRDTVLENYWDRSLPMFASGQIELQAHRTPVWFKNLYIREIKP